MRSYRFVLLGAFAALSSVFYFPIRQRYITLGIGRTQHKIQNIHGVEELRIIPNTLQCEDLHHEKTTNMLFTACQKNIREHSLWFPPNALFTDPTAIGPGLIVRVDPETFKETVLKMNGSPGPMVTHGIDILNDSEDPSLLWIYIVNHLPNPDRWFVQPPLSTRPERAQIEIFKHTLGTDEVEYVRSVRHPRILMPNDIVAIFPSSFYVSDDHNYHTGVLRLWEDMGTQYTAPSSSVLLVHVADMSNRDPTSGINVTVALNSIHNSNGLGRGSPHHPNEVCVIDATGGILTRTKRDPDPHALNALTILERIQMDCTLDNPSYYWDMYATATNNASGYILPGLANAINMISDFPYLDRPIPSCVYHIRAHGSVKFDERNTWERRLIFQDSGKKLRSASGAVMIGIDPEQNGGRKQAWLFVTGFGSEAMVAAKIDL